MIQPGSINNIPHYSNPITDVLKTDDLLNHIFLELANPHSYSTFRDLTLVNKKWNSHINKLSPFQLKLINNLFLKSNFEPIESFEGNLFLKLLRQYEIKSGYSLAKQLESKKKPEITTITYSDDFYPVEANSLRYIKNTHVVYTVDNVFKCIKFDSPQDCKIIPLPGTIDFFTTFANTIYCSQPNGQVVSFSTHNLDKYIATYDVPYNHNLGTQTIRNILANSKWLILVSSNIKKHEEVFSVFDIESGNLKYYSPQLQITTFQLDGDALFSTNAHCVRDDLVLNHEVYCTDLKTLTHTCLSNKLALNKNEEEVKKIFSKSNFTPLSIFGSRFSYFNEGKISYVDLDEDLAKTTSSVFDESSNMSNILPRKEISFTDNIIKIKDMGRLKSIEHDRINCIDPVTKKVLHTIKTTVPLKMSQIHTYENSIMYLDNYEVVKLDFS